MTLVDAGEFDGDAVPPEWEQAIASMRADVDSLRRQGQWRSGRRTLMHALGIQYRETYLTAGLAWLLDPDGWHGLGDHVLSGLLIELRLPGIVERPVSVATEETGLVGQPPAVVRADLVVRSGEVSVLVEAKTKGYERTRQCDDLAEAWESENPILVFLTRHGRQPQTAVMSVDAWRTLTWSRVAAIIRAAVEQTTDCAPGVQDLLATIEIFGGGKSIVPTDGKVAFYLEHRPLIAAWADLWEQARNELEVAFAAAVTAQQEGSTGPQIYLNQSDKNLPAYEITLDLRGAPGQIAVALGWVRTQVLKGSPTYPWPYVGVKIKDNGAGSPAFATVLQLVRSAARKLGWNETTDWPQWKNLPLATGESDLDLYAVACVTELVDAWRVVQSAIDSSIDLCRLSRDQMCTAS